MFFDLPIVVVLFGILWLGEVASGILIPLAVSTFSQTIDSVQVCLMNTIQQYLTISIILSMVFDTLVFVAVSFRIITMLSLNDNANIWLGFFRGKGLPRLSRALLQSGQTYYLYECIFHLTSMKAHFLQSNSNLERYHSFLDSIPRRATNISCSSRFAKSLDCELDGLQSIPRHKV
jgi:hypothetical protein